MTLIKSVIKIKSHKNKYKSHKNKVSHTDFNNNQHVLPFTGKDWRTNRWSIHQAKYTQMNSLRHTSSHLAERLISLGGGGTDFYNLLLFNGGQRGLSLLPSLFKEMFLSSPS